MAFGLVIWIMIGFAPANLIGSGAYAKTQGFGTVKAVENPPAIDKALDKGDNDTVFQIVEQDNPEEVF